jgi:hypothetical protein
MSGYRALNWKDGEPLLERYERRPIGPGDRNAYWTVGRLLEAVKRVVTPPRLEPDDRACTSRELRALRARVAMLFSWYAAELGPEREDYRAAIAALEDAIEEAARREARAEVEAPRLAALAFAEKIFRDAGVRSFVRIPIGDREFGDPIPEVQLLPARGGRAIAFVRELIAAAPANAYAEPGEVEGHDPIVVRWTSIDGVPGPGRATGFEIVVTLLVDEFQVVRELWKKNHPDRDLGANP